MPRRQGKARNNAKKKEEEEKRLEKSGELVATTHCPICEEKITILPEKNIFGMFTVPKHDRKNQKGRRCPFSGEAICVANKLAENNISKIKFHSRTIKTNVGARVPYNGTLIGMVIDIEDYRKENYKDTCNNTLF